MRARHGQRSATTRPGLRWLAGALGVGLTGAAVLAGTAAGAASGDDVTAVFSVTGVSTSNCSVSTGGADVYIEPGATLNAKSNLVGITVLSLGLGLGDLKGVLTVDPGTAAKHVYNLGTKDTTPIPDLPSGNHPFTWQATGPLGIQLNLDAKLAAAGAALDYRGTIHVTTAAPNCGVAVQVPGPSISVSVTKLPPIQVSLPPVNVSVPVDPGKILSQLPSLPLPTKKPTTPATTPAFSYTPPPPTVPEQVVPTGHGGVYPGNSGGGYFGGSLPGVATTTTPTRGAAATTTAAPAPSASSSAPADPAAAKQAKDAQLAAAKAPSAQLPVVLAILAVIALAVVTATYARLYLLRRTS
jgi:hypothetical protein